MTGQSNIRIGRRRGYTLIEMIISMVLVSALMSSVWGVMSLYNSLLTAGRDQTTQQQLVRSVFQLIDEDLSGVIAPSEPVVAAAIDDLSETLEFSLPDFADSFDDEPPSGAPPVQLSLIGTSTAMRLSVRRFVVPVREPPSDMDLLNELGGGSLSSDSPVPDDETVDVPEFQTIVYQLQAPGGADSLNSLSSGLYRLQANTAEFQSLIAQQSTAEQNMATDDVGVGRATLEALLFPAADSLADDAEDTESEMPAVSFERIPEVVDCQFEYFNGQTWQGYWSANEESRLPVAVRVSLDVVSGTDVQQMDLLNPPGPDADPFAARTGDGSVADASTLSEAGADESATVIRATRFERTILLDAVHSPVSALAGGMEGSFR